MRRALQITLTVIGIVMLTAGVQGMIGGAEIVLGDEPFSDDVDSEFRFHATWYAAAGILLLRSIERVESEAMIVRAVGVAFFVAGCARALSIVEVGRPETFYVVLMVIEFVIPLVIIPWQAAVARRSSRGDATPQS